MIKLRNITLGFKDKTLICKGNMDIPYEQVTLLVGESGSGKTTLLEEIGLLANRAVMDYELDKVLIHNCNEIEKNEIRKNDISFIFQENNLFDHFNLRDNIYFYARLYNHTIDENQIHELLDFVGLSLDLSTPIKNLSGGERQRLAIVCGLIKESKIFIFDEPTAFLDEDNRIKIIELIYKLAHEKHKIVLVASHDQDFINISDQIYQIDNKKIINIKKDKYDEQEVKSIEKVINSKSLRYFIYKKTFKKNILIGSIFAIFLIVLSVVFLYGNQLKEADEEELLQSVHHIASIIRIDEKEMTITEQAKLERQLFNYNIYPYIDNLITSVQCNQIRLDNVYIKSYYPTSLGSKDILETKNTNSSIYMTYELARYLKNENTDIIEIGDKECVLSGSLNPSYDTEKAIYVPYNTLDKYFKDNGIDLKNQKNKELIIEFKSLNDLREISINIEKPYFLYTTTNILTQAQILHVFESGYIFIIFIVLFIIMIVYRIYTIIDEKYEVGLLKTMGVDNKKLIIMKLIEELYIFGISYICFFILLVISLWLYPKSYMYVLLLEGCMFLLLVLTLIIYYIYICRKSISGLIHKI